MSRWTLLRLGLIAIAAIVLLPADAEAFWCDYDNGWCFTGDLLIVMPGGKFVCNDFECHSACMPDPQPWGTMYFWLKRNDTTSSHSCTFNGWIGGYPQCRSKIPSWASGTIGRVTTACL